jgi:hypothetical protein
MASMNYTDADGKLIGDTETGTGVDVKTLLQPHRHLLPYSVHVLINLLQLVPSLAPDGTLGTNLSHRRCPGVNARIAETCADKKTEKNLPARRWTH